jgi:hypothetical protein
MATEQNRENEANRENPENPENPENLENLENLENPRRGPLDGSVSGTIGGGGADTGGPTPRPKAPDMPRVKPEDAASGRRAPDTLGATAEPDELKPGPSDSSPS